MNNVKPLHHLDACDNHAGRNRSLVTQTGYAMLDDMLPAGGWPTGGVVEIITPHPCAGGVDLLIPALVRLARKDRRIALVTPPFEARHALYTNPDISAAKLLQVNPHPGRSTLWTVESMLATGDFSAILAWPGCATGLMDLRLQRAAARGKALCVLFRRPVQRTVSSSATVRLGIDVGEGGRVVNHLDDRGEPLAGVLV